MGEVHYKGLVFDGEFLSARSDDGSVLRFTRQERALLIAFDRRRGSLLTRNQLLDALSGSDVEMNERNVDFLVNRLRTKLGDRAREPRFIATQYGEGYVWIAKPETGQPLSAFLVIGPAFGLDARNGGGERAILTALAERLDAITAANLPVLCRPDWRPGANPADAVRYSLDASFHDDGTRLHAALVLRDGTTRQILKAFRAALPRAEAGTAIEGLADEIKAAIWSHLSRPAQTDSAPADTPIEVRLHDAALMLARAPESWLESDAQIERAAETAPNDPALAIMRGMSRYTKLLSHLGLGHSLSDEEWSAMEDEIEALALNSLPHIGDNPLLMLGAAKLLFSIDRGHFERAEALAEEAFERSTAFAAAFSTMAQLRMYRGRIDEAVALYDKAIEMSEKGSEFHLYLLVLKCGALLAANNREALAAASAALYAANPLTRVHIGPFLVSADEELPPDLASLAAALDETHARRLIAHLYYVSARRFLTPEHRGNVMRGLTTHLVRRFGEDVVPPKVAEALGRSRDGGKTA